jgi:hypothetical protein
MLVPGPTDDNLAAAAKARAVATGIERGLGFEPTYCEAGKLGLRKPGYLLIGGDGTGKLSSLDVTDELLLNLGASGPLPGKALRYHHVFLRQ